MTIYTSELTVTKSNVFSCKYLAWSRDLACEYSALVVPSGEETAVFVDY